MPSSCADGEDVCDIEDCIRPGEPGPADRLRAENRVLPRALRRKASPRDRPAIESFVPGTQSVYVKTWGCSHNNSDGEYMAGMLADSGYTITDSPLSADLWLLNSCTVKGPSEDGLKNSIRKGKELGKSLVIAGCVPQGQKTHYDVQGLSVVGVQQIDRVVEVVEETLKGNTVRLFGQKRLNGRKLGGAPLDLPKIRKNPLIEIIPINTGCLNQCTYCKTKHARGDLGSYPPGEIVSRAIQAFQEGVVEVWLTSEDLGAYGHDIGVTLPELLWQLVAVIPPSCMLRLGMTNPPYIMEHLEEMAQILAHERVYSFLHVPVQCGSDTVLGDMKREYSVADFRYVVDFLRKRIPDVTIATDIICGFPTETVEDFDLTLQLVEEYRFPSLFINQFYPRPGTPAARLRRIPTHEVKRRSRQLSKLFQSYQPYSHKLGQRQTVLITEESHDHIHLVAHNKFYEQVLVRKEPDMMGRMFDVIISSTGKHYLIGDVVRGSLPLTPSRPPPLPYGTISGARSPSLQVCVKREGVRGDRWWLTLGDIILLLLALCIVCVAVCVHYSQFVSIFR